MKRLFLIDFVFLGLFFFLSPLDLHAEAQSLESKKFKVCGVNVELELARTAPQIKTGLMHRDSLEDGKGMLFMFDHEQVLRFWMKNVPFDIDIGYFNKGAELVKALTMKGTSPLTLDEFLPRYSSVLPAQYAVELPKGFFAKHRSARKACRIEPHPAEALK